MEEKKDRFEALWNLLKGLGIILGIVLGLGIFYVISSMGPNRNLFKVFESSPRILRRDDEAAARITERSKELEKKFEEVMRFRKPTSEDLALLKQAIDLQTEAIELSGSINSEGRVRLSDLTVIYHDQMSIPLLEESLEIEKQARKLEDELDHVGALKKYRAAMEMQQKINTEYGQGKSFDIGRFARLERKCMEVESKPIFEESKDEERLGEEALKREDWKSAKAYFMRALELQDKLNSEFRGIAYSNVQRSAELRSRVDSLESTDVARRIRELTQQAESFLAEKRYPEASESFQTALRLQRELNEKYPQSMFSSTENVEKLKKASDDARSYGVATEIMEEVSRIDLHLRKRDVWKAMEGIEDITRKALVFTESFREHPVVTKEVVTKLEYLTQLRTELNFYQGRLYGMLVPVPGHPSVYMLRSEVSQALYQNLTFSNPSRQRGENLPVDSVTWYDAQLFAQRMSWILGLPVRLPKVDEFKAAVGSLRYVKLEEQAWIAQNSSDRVQAIETRAKNANGFHDLLGNVSEWLEPSGLLGEAESYIAGGNARDSIDEIAEVSVEIISRRSRDLMVGFRVVVDGTGVPVDENR